MATIIVYSFKFIQKVYPSTARSTKYYDKLSLNITFDPDKAGRRKDRKSFMEIVLVNYVKTM